MPKKSWPILCGNLLYQIGQVFLDIQYVQINTDTKHTEGILLGVEESLPPPTSKFR